MRFSYYLNKLCHRSLLFSLFVSCCLKAGYAEPQRQSNDHSSTSTLYADSQAYFDGSDQHSSTRRFLSQLPLAVWHDQKRIFFSPLSLSKSDLRWLLPLAATTGLLLSTDHHVMTLIHTNASNRSNSDLVANGGVAGFAGLAGLSYGIGVLSHNEHLRETGQLTAQALADTYLAVEALKIFTSRDRPDGNSAHGRFERVAPLNSSFPSAHSALAWTAATVFAHEYPGPVTQWSAYGLASIVSVARLTGYHHFPSDVLIGAAAGYLIGRFAYRTKHNDLITDRTGATPVNQSTPATFSTVSIVRPRAKSHASTGSPYVPLDSWIYPALKRLAALGYVSSQVAALAPWTRSECLQQVEEAADAASTRDSFLHRAVLNQEALKLIAGLEAELKDDEYSNNVVRLESLYMRVTGIRGTPLRDSYHFGQTIANDFGRPYERGIDNISGFSTYATSGQFFTYFRGEYQYAGGRANDPSSVRQFIGNADGNPVQTSNTIRTTNGFQTQEMYAGVRLGFENITFGKQDFWWGPGEESAFSFSTNAQPFYSLRFAQARPFVIPGVFSHLGKIRTELIFGKLSGHRWPPRPYVNAQKISLALTDNLELGFTRSAFFGGVGHPLTIGSIVNDFVSTSSTGGSYFGAANDPGDRHSGFDFRYRIPGLRRYLTVYSDSYADDDPSPLANPRRAAWGPGLYLSRVPYLRKLDFRFETYSTLLYDRDYGGGFIYWNGEYHDAYTNKQYLLGSWIGRDSRAYSASTTYWAFPRTSLKASYRQIKAGAAFLPGGGTQTDVGLSGQISLSPEWMVSSKVNYERYYLPILGGPRRAFLFSLQVVFTPSLQHLTVRW